MLLFTQVSRVDFEWQHDWHRITKRIVNRTNHGHDSMSSDRLVLHIYLEPEVVRLCAPLNNDGTLHRCCGFSRGL